MEEKWTQDEAIAFECAKECITHLMAIWTARIASGELTPDQCEKLRVRRAELALERQRLRVHDHADIARIRSVYGQTCRQNLSSEGASQGQGGSRSPECNEGNG